MRSDWADCCDQCDEDGRSEADRDSFDATMDAIYRLVCETVGHGAPAPRTFRLRTLEPVGKEWNWTVCPTCRTVLGGEPVPALTAADDSIRTVYTSDAFFAALEAPSPFWTAINA